MKIILTIVGHTRIAQLLPYFYVNLIIEGDCASNLIKDKEIIIYLTLVYDILGLKNEGLEILNSCHVEF
jgi:hypothetical protein